MREKLNVMKEENATYKQEFLKQAKINAQT